MGKALDLTGKRYGHLTALYITDRSKWKHDYIREWTCKCDCGNEISIPTGSFNIGNYKTCGKKCPFFHRNQYDLVGERFGALTVLGLAKKSDWKHGYRSWYCICDCGKECIAHTAQLTHGIMKTCGCKITQKKNKQYSAI